MSDIQTMMAAFALLAQYNDPQCGCVVKTSFRSAEESGGIRDCLTVETDSSQCPIEDHKPSWVRRR